MQKNHDLLASQGRLGFGEARRDESGLAGDGQRIEDGSFEQPLGAGDQVRREANLPLEPAGKGFALDRLAKGIPRGSDPDAASGQLAFDIGDRFAVRPDDKPD